LSFGKIWQFGAVNGGYRLRAPYITFFLYYPPARIIIIIITTY